LIEIPEKDVKITAATKLTAAGVSAPHGRLNAATAIAIPD
jgi:hypothetical protein